MMLKLTPVLVGLAVLVGAAACDTAGPPALTSPVSPSPGAFFVQPSNGSAGELSAEANQGIAQLRRLLAPFHNLDKAMEYGYDTYVACLSDPVRGGMGHHYGFSTPDLVLDGEVNLLEPEFLVYSPDGHGHQRLSAVDYFVPYATWTDPEPPSLLGVPFHDETALSAYVLHIWAFWPNPAGIFENYNPDVPPC